ncbi:hypothetical protein [Geobacter sp.]|uniref:hypothetical protein n=1 Tax=Geobacter sp. TaxID=46610 RepID=UPI002612BDA6|nr:hypothetical protein [Geobacter sp.]
MERPTCRFCNVPMGQVYLEKTGELHIPATYSVDQVTWREKSAAISETGRSLTLVAYICAKCGSVEFFLDRFHAGS